MFNNIYMNNNFKNNANITTYMLQRLYKCNCMIYNILKLYIYSYS